MGKILVRVDDVASSKKKIKKKEKKDTSVKIYKS